MRLATVETSAGSRAVRIEDQLCVDLGYPDVMSLLGDPRWRQVAATAEGSRLPLDEVKLLSPVPTPGKILCVGLNYRTHILEMGRDIPQYPTLFAKYPEALVGPGDPIVRPAESKAVDWEAELALVIGRRVRHASTEEAGAAIAGFSGLNDVTIRDWQYRTPQWLQGKTFEATSPFGPCLVTPDDLPGTVTPEVELRCLVDGALVQQANTGDMVFTPVDLVRYASSIMTLNPGDVIATGTPSGVGHGQDPPRYLAAGSVLRTEISGIGVLENRVVEAV